MTTTKTGLAALVMACCFGTVSTAEAGPTKAAPAAAPPSGATLAVDCAKAEKDPRCGRVSWAKGGTIGAGPAVNGGQGFPSIGDGFIDGNRLVAAVELGGQFDDNGAIMSFDLTSGDRTILSGKMEDLAKGPVT